MSDLCATKKEEVVFVDGDARAEDIQQGSLGDCWLLSAMACVTSHKNSDLIKNVFVKACVVTSRHVRQCG